VTTQSLARRAGRPAAPGRLRVTPGRAAVLLFGMPVLIVLIGFLAFSAVTELSQASYPVRIALPVRDGQMTVNVDSGDITLRQSAAGQQAELTGTAYYSLFRQNVTVSGSTVSYACNFAFGNCAFNATVSVPAATAVSVFTGGGDVTVPRFAGRLALNSDGGDVTAGRLSGDLDLATGGGDLTASAAAGSLAVNSDGGDVVIGAVTALQPAIRSGGGDVVLTFTSVPDNLQVNSDGGDVTLILPRADYRIDANADGGSYSSAFGDDSSAQRSVTVDSGGGDITLKAAG
jgi:hypothetical protein